MFTVTQCDLKVQRIKAAYTVSHKYTVQAKRDPKDHVSQQREAQTVTSEHQDDEAL